MSPMQEFYDKLQSDDPSKDEDLQKMKLLAHASLEQIAEYPVELGWYYWFSSPE